MTKIYKSGESTMKNYRIEEFIAKWPEYQGKHWAKKNTALARLATKITKLIMAYANRELTFKFGSPMGWPFSPSMKDNS